MLVHDDAVQHGGVFIRDKGKATRMARWVLHHDAVDDGAILAKMLVQRLVRRVPAETAYKQLPKETQGGV